MNNISTELVDRLVAEYGFRPKGKWLQQGVCPQCGKKELFSSAEKPHLVNCSRENKCGWSAHVRDLYPEVFEGFSKRFKPTKANPTATADAYLQMQRGFDLDRIKGWYTQGRFYSSQKDAGASTVRFLLNGNQLFWERFIDNTAKIGRKAHFEGSYGGLWWQPQGLTIEPGDEIWWVEGIFDAIALHHHGIKAVALLTCNNYPAKAVDPYLGKQIRWVLALDSDKAGRKYTHKFNGILRQAGEQIQCAQIPQQGKSKTDWNDLHLQEKLGQADRENYLHHGALLTAPSPISKAVLIYQKEAYETFHFEYRSRLYWWKLDLKAFNAAKEQLLKEDEYLTDIEVRDAAIQQCGAVVQIANCYPQALYYQANEMTDEAWYYFRIRFPAGGQAKNTFTGSQLSGATEFKKRLLAIAAGGLFTGASSQLDRLLQQQIHGIKVVQTLDFVGYSKNHSCYVLPDIAIKEGRTYQLNDEDFFDLPRLSIKTLSNLTLHINHDPKEYRHNWARQVYQCWGPSGIVAAAFWLGSLFAEQIRDHTKSFPFIEIIGEPQSGKTTMIEFLWKLLGRRDYEGFDPSKSTLAARSRNFAQVANMPVVLMEGDRDEDTAKARRFDWDELKPLYNGRSTRSRGMKNSGNETYEPPFRGALVITQNAEVNASEAVLQRIIHLRMTREGQSPETKQISEELERTPVEAVSHFMIKAVQQESDILALVAKHAPVHADKLLRMDGINNIRIAKNHGQIMALVDALKTLVNLPEEMAQAVRDKLKSMAEERQIAISADHPMVQEFWDTVEYIGINHLNHASEASGLIAISLNDFVHQAAINKQNIPPMIELKRHLKSSRLHKFLHSNKPVKSVIRQMAMRCWVFSNSAKPLG